MGLCEELVKAAPVILRFRSEDQLSWQGACLWGLASGIGFGVAEGIIYSSDFYNGVHTWPVYYVRFLSCVSLHAVWSGAVGIMVWRCRDQWNDVEWSDLFVTLVVVLGVPVVLHGLYDTLLKKDYPAWALVTALASFGWLYLLMYMTGREAQDEHMARRARAKQRGINGLPA